MKNLIHSMAGVTLLEIMLVLAIAAMIIVMSIRYYQSATSASQANTVAEQISAITAAADSIASGTGYASVGGTPPAVANLLPANGLATPWGETILITNAKATSYDVTIPQVPGAVCVPLQTKLSTNAQFTNLKAQCSGKTSGAITYTYSITATS